MAFDVKPSVTTPRGASHATQHIGTMRLSGTIRPAASHGARRIARPRISRWAVSMIPRMASRLLGLSQPFHVVLRADRIDLKRRNPVSSLLKKKSQVANRLLKAGSDSGTECVRKRDFQV
ncbi:hypothetical protein [Burkholderia metallica]|uniref:hypothetical protein n=1 Tax=Burkholderia metallica TaxID=488729 RepID=UPI001CF2A200|nr:hypothetical protein [Burkholderia metallica]MCA8018915.1 hypothetical protein [Burkholderia metallica]